MRLEENPQLPTNAESTYLQNLNFTLARMFRNIAIKLNGVSDGRIAACDLVASSIPTTGTYAVGDFIRNSAPAELGSASSKYVIKGWICTVAGTPGTLLQVRTLTGN